VSSRCEARRRVARLRQLAERVDGHIVLSAIENGYSRTGSPGGRSRGWILGPRQSRLETGKRCAYAPLPSIRLDSRAILVATQRLLQLLRRNRVTPVSAVQKMNMIFVVVKDQAGQ